MKKIVTLFSLAIVLVACNREDDTIQGPAAIQKASDAGVVHYLPEDLPGSILNLNESFGVSAKAAGPQLNYTYRAYAPPVTLSGGTIDLAAAAVFEVDDVVFVCWHRNDFGGGNTLGASIAAYKWSGIGQYTFMDRADFPNHDFHKMSAHKNLETGNIEVFVAGQRDKDNSGYLLSGHLGATVTRIDYDYINDEFWEPSFKELPLPGNAATDIVALAANYYVLCGNGTGGPNGGLYQIDRAMEYVKQADQNNISDGIALAVNPRTTNASEGDLYVLDRDGARHRIHKGQALNNGNFSSSSLVDHSDNNGGATITPIDYERGDLVWCQGVGTAPAAAQIAQSNGDSLIICVGSNGIFQAGGDATTGANTAGGIVTPTGTPNYGACTGGAFDAGLGVFYYAAGDDVWVLAMGEYANAAGPLVQTHDVIGRFVPPATTPGFAQFNVKDVNVHQSRNITMVSGDGGVYFVQRDKN